MPIYEYECNVCRYRFEEIQGIDDPVPDECLSCGQKDTLRRLISKGSFVLKGGGWYVTDFKGQRKDRAN